MEITCQAFKLAGEPKDGKPAGKLVGYCRLQVGVFVLNDCKIIRGKNGAFIGLPTRAFKQGATTRYMPVIEIRGRDNVEAFQRAALEAVKRFQEARRR